MNSSSSGIGFLGTLAIVFIILKLTHFIHWGWVWVLSPLWIPVAFVSVLGMVWLTFVIIKGE